MRTALPWILRKPRSEAINLDVQDWLNIGEMGDAEMQKLVYNQQSYYYYYLLNVRSTRTVRRQMNVACVFVSLGVWDKVIFLLPIFLEVDSNIHISSS